MGARRVIAALIAVVLLFSGALAEGKWSVKLPEEKAEAAFDGAYYTAKGRLSAVLEDSYGAAAALPQQYEFELSVREAADGWNAELLLDTLTADAGVEPAISNRLEASLSIGAAGGSGLLAYTLFDSQGNPLPARRFSAAFGGDHRLIVRDESSGSVIFDSGALEAFGVSASEASAAAWGEALPLLEARAMVAFGPLLNKIEGFLYGEVDSTVVRVRELALPIAQLFSDPLVEGALSKIGTELPASAMYDVLDLLEIGRGTFELKRLDGGNLAITYLSEGSPETSGYKVEAVLRPSGLDFKVLDSTYDGGYETLAGGEIDLSDGLHIAFDDYSYEGFFLYLDATPGEMSAEKQVLDARAAYKLDTYDDPALLLLHFENAVDASAGTARTDATLRAVDTYSAATITLEIDHTFKE